MIAVSRDDGLTWRSQQAVQDAGWNLGSVSCADASHCWAAANGFTTEALMGTADGGRSDPGPPGRELRGRRVLPERAGLRRHHRRPALGDRRQWRAGIGSVT
jgi:hypothetical protein